MSDTKRACTICVLCLRQDYGYSNWTVEGTSLHCLAGLNPALDGEDEPWRDVTPELVKQAGYTDDDEAARFIAIDNGWTDPAVVSGRSNE